jgi:anaerobic dimethyl sulfoxide reductase subunit B (iron-sulfur subunit)
MDQYGFFFEASKCVGCKACEIACKNLHPVGKGIQFRTVTTIESGTFPDLKVVNISTACRHCGDPGCAAVCPTGAISKRVEDGIVVVDEAKCIGCHSCLSGCPFGIPEYSAGGKMVKCDMCLDRKEIGLEPACVRSCFYDALHAGSLTELAAKARDKANRLAAEASHL